MTVKHVSASRTPGLLGTNRRRPLNIAAARPAQKSTVIPGESKALTEGEDAAAQRSQSEFKVAVEDTTPEKPSGAHAPRIKTRSGAEQAADALLTAVEPAASLSPPAGPAVDYYAIVSKTVSGLALNNAETRSDVYDRARTIVQDRLNEAGSAVSSHMVAVEQIAFDRAIRKIEAEQLELLRARAASVKAAPPSADIAPAEAALSSPTPAEQVVVETETAQAVPTIVLPKRPRPVPKIPQIHGGTLRLFALIGFVIAGFATYWLIAGKPNFAGLRNITRIVTKAPQPTPQEETVNTALAPAGVAPTEQKTASALPAQAATSVVEQVPVASTANDIDAVSPDAYVTQLATFLSLCSPAKTTSGDDACGNLQPRPFGGPGVTPRNAPEWVAMYASLSQIPVQRVKAPVFGSPPLPAAPSNTATAAGEAPARTANVTARERYERGLELAKNDGLDAAVNSFSEAIRLDPKFADAYVQRGQAMFKNGDVERAVADFTQALQIDARNVAAFKARGMAMLYRGDDDNAIIDLTKAIQYAEIDPASIPAIEVFYARRSRATLYDRKQLYDRELVDLTAMIDGYWRDPSLAAALKSTYRDQGAAALIGSIYRLRAVVHQKRNSIEAAIGDLSFALQLDGQRTLQYLIERGRMLETAGRREQAIADYQQALEMSPNNTDVRNSLTRLKGRT